MSLIANRGEGGGVWPIVSFCKNRKVAQTWQIQNETFKIQNTKKHSKLGIDNMMLWQPIF